MLPTFLMSPAGFHHPKISNHAFNSIGIGFDRQADRLCADDLTKARQSACSKAFIKKVMGEMTIQQSQDLEDLQEGVAGESDFDLADNLEELVDASESLLKRIQQDQLSAYASPASRIHVLAFLIRKQLFPSAQSRFRIAASPRVSGPPSPAFPESQCLSADCTDGELARFTPEVAEKKQIEITPNSHWRSDVDSEFHLRIQPQKSLDFHVTEPAMRSKRVLIVDQSPFFRMLLSLVIDAAGYESQAASNLGELMCDSGKNGHYAVVLWGGLHVMDEMAPLLEWIQTRNDLNSEETKIIGLVDRLEGQAIGPGDPIHLVSRTDLTGLVTQIARHLGPASKLVRQVA